MNLSKLYYIWGRDVKKRTVFSLQLIKNTGLKKDAREKDKVQVKKNTE